MYYTITKAQADLLTRFEYEPGKIFDPYVAEQEDGTYLVDEVMYNVLKTHTNFTKVNFISVPKISVEQIKNKIDQVKEVQPGEK